VTDKNSCLQQNAVLSFRLYDIGDHRL